MIKIPCPVGQKIGRLTVLAEGERRPGRRGDGSQGLHRCWRCRCDCGTIREVRVNDLRQGNVLSCGCSRQDKQNVEARIASRSITDDERVQLQQRVDQAGGVYALARTVHARPQTVSRALKGWPVRPHAIARLLRAGTLPSPQASGEAPPLPPCPASAEALLARVPLTPTATPVIESWGHELGLTRAQVWEALEGALGRGELARDLGPTGLRWRKEKR